MNVENRMSENRKTVNRNFNNLKTQVKKNQKGQSVEELSNRSAGVVVVRKTEEDKLLVLLMRAYNYWDFPKGKIEIGERVIDAAIRETGEEAGIKELKFLWGRDHTQTAPYGIVQKISYYFLAETSESQIVMQINPESGQAEHEEYRWLSFEAAHALAVPRIKEVLHWAHDKILKLTPDYLPAVSVEPSETALTTTPASKEKSTLKSKASKNTTSKSVSASASKPLVKSVENPSASKELSKTEKYFMVKGKTGVFSSASASAIAIAQTAHNINAIDSGTKKANTKTSMPSKFKKTPSTDYLSVAVRDTKLSSSLAVLSSAHNVRKSAKLPQEKPPSSSTPSTPSATTGTNPARPTTSYKRK